MVEGKVLITGITGMIGRELAQFLLQQDCEVHGVARYSRPGSEDEIASWGVTTWQKDLARDPFDDMPEFDYVFHEAAFWDKSKRGVENKRAVMDTNTLAAGRVMARWRRAKGILLASTGGIHHESDTPINEDTDVQPNPDRQNYHLAKFAMEQVGVFCSVQFGVPTVILRYFWPVRHEDVARRAVEAVLAGEPMRGVDPEEPYQWTPVDLADLIYYTARSVEAAAAPPTILICGGPEAITRKDLCDIAGEVLGKKPVYDDEAQFHWERFLADSTRLYRLFGEPKSRLTEVVRRLAQAARDH